MTDVFNYYKPDYGVFVKTDCGRRVESLSDCVFEGDFFEETKNSCIFAFQTLK